jgi:hypothetical protein
MSFALALLTSIHQHLADHNQHALDFSSSMDGLGGRDPPEAPPGTNGLAEAGTTRDHEANFVRESAMRTHGYCMRVFANAH